MHLLCPLCYNGVDSSALRLERGKGGAFHCPNCNSLVRFSRPYQRHIAVFALFAAWCLLFASGVRRVLTLLIASAVLWVPISLILNTVMVRVVPLTLEAWKPRKPRRLYKRQEPPSIR